MVANKNQDSGSEFQIQNEDFPALPGTSQSDSSLQQDSKSLGKTSFGKTSFSKITMILFPKLFVEIGNSSPIVFCSRVKRRRKRLARSLVSA